MQKFLVFLKTNKKYLLWMSLFLIASAVALTWFLEYRYFLNNSDRTWQFFNERPLVFWYNSLIMLVMLLFLSGLSRRPVIAAGLMWIILIILSYVHINKFQARGAPLLPEDFTLAAEAASLSKFVDMGSVLRMVLAIILVIVLSILINQWTRKKLLTKTSKEEKAAKQRYLIGGQVVIVLCSVLVFLGLTSFVRNHSGQRYEEVPWLNSQLVAWNQVRNYDYNGFILGFLYNFKKLELKKPEEYNKDKLAEMKEKYSKIAKAENEKKVDLSEEGVNIVIVLKESFYDPSISFQGYSFEDYYTHTGGEILPNLRRIQKEHASGYMYSTEYGGGTANIEFEILTGFSNYFYNTIPYTYLLPRSGDIISLASYLKHQNYKTGAVHPFNGAMYKRNIALRNLGYDKFISELDMKYKEKEGKSEYINDKSAYLETLDLLNSSKENQIITTITMQGHLPYNSDIYENKQFTITNDNLDEGKKAEIASYYQILHETDKHLGNFLAELDKSDKKVAVLLFGDHSAGIFDITNSHENKKIRDLSRIAPYFVYTNYLPKGEKALAMTTPNCLSNTLMNTLNAKKPEFYYLLDKVCEETPILTNAWFDTVAPESTPILKEYETVTYDFLGGKKYWGNY